MHVVLGTQTVRRDLPLSYGGVRVRTDMGGPNAPLGVEDRTPGIADAITSQAGRTDIRFLDYRGRVIWW